MTDKTLLHPHDPFPALTVSLPGGRALRLPDDLAGHFGVVLFYRGSWCPYCNAQLSAFQRALDSLAEMGVTVAALSVDDEATTQELISQHGLRFPVGYGAYASGIAEATGAFVNDDPLFLQSTGFVLDPGGRVVVSVYSSGAIGRLVPQDVIGLVRYLRLHAAASESRVRPLASVAAHRGQQRLEVLTARAARAQVRGDARVPLLRRFAGGDQVDVDVQHLHRLGAADVARIGPQEAVQRRPAVNERPESSSSRYPLAARAARSLRRASNIIL
jgi:peroxiredoxin